LKSDINHVQKSSTDSAPGAAALGLSKRALKRMKKKQRQQPGTVTPSINPLDLRFAEATNQVVPKASDGSDTSSTLVPPSIPSERETDLSDAALKLVPGFKNEKVSSDQ
jgi:hypothetical protein